MTLHPHLGGGVPSTVRRATVWLSGNTTRVLWHNAAAAAASAAGRLHLDRAAAARGGDAAAADAAAAPHHAAPKKNKRGGGRLKRTVRKGGARPARAQALNGSSGGAHQQHLAGAPWRAGGGRPRRARASNRSSGGARGKPIAQVPHINSGGVRRQHPVAATMQAGGAQPARVRPSRNSSGGARHQPAAAAVPAHAGAVQPARAHGPDRSGGGGRHQPAAAVPHSGSGGARHQPAAAVAVHAAGAARPAGARPLHNGGGGVRHQPAAVVPAHTEGARPARAPDSSSSTAGARHQPSAEVPVHAAGAARPAGARPSHSSGGGVRRQHPVAAPAHAGAAQPARARGPNGNINGARHQPAAVRVRAGAAQPARTRFSNGLPPEEVPEYHCPSSGAVVKKLLRFWTLHSQREWDRVAEMRSSSRPRDAVSSRKTAEVLRAEGVLFADEMCYSKFVYANGTVTMLDTFAEHCRAPGLAQSSRYKGQIYAALWTHMLKSRGAEAAGWRPFAWVMDLTSGSRSNLRLRRAFELPTLAVAASPLDHSVMLVPDFYTLMSLVTGTGLNYVIPSALKANARGYKEAFFETPLHAAEWVKKKGLAVFRGSCHPTIDSAAKKLARVPVRSQVCTRYGGDPSFDIGTYTRGGASPCDSPAHENSHQFCIDCKKCAHKERLKPADMMNYKYQLLLDGYGPGYDSNIWKLLSGGTAFQVHPDELGGPIFSMYYYPLLKPYVHYIPANFSGLGAAVAWCHTHDKECERIARNARAVAGCFLNMEVASEYLWGVLKRLHAFHFPPAS